MIISKINKLIVRIDMLYILYYVQMMLFNIFIDIDLLSLKVITIYSILIAFIVTIILNLSYLAYLLIRKPNEDIFLDLVDDIKIITFIMVASQLLK